MEITRRNLMAKTAAATALVGMSRRAQGATDPLSGEMLFADVKRYADLGVHRTGTTGDNATTNWLKARLQSLDFAVQTQDVSCALFVPDRCEMSPPSGDPVQLFPSWPVVPTDGISAVLRIAGDASRAIAIVDLPVGESGSLDDSGVGDALLAAQKEGAVAVVGLCGGPTGEVIARNARFKRFSWNIPVLLAPGRARARLLAAAQFGDVWRIVSSGSSTPGAVAQSVIARRPGRGKTICISTPKSGWFRCAGERGTGIAIWLALAATLSQTDADLLFTCITGHELDNIGGRAFLRYLAPDPKDVKFWLDIGTDVAVDAVNIRDSTISRSMIPVSNRSAYASAGLLDLATSAFRGQPGYSRPIEIETAPRHGEFTVIHDRGYAPFMGLIGAGALFHTPSDAPEYATSPALLEPVMLALNRIVATIAAT
jgi:hypothetical protein